MKMDIANQPEPIKFSAAARQIGVSPTQLRHWLTCVDRFPAPGDNGYYYLSEELVEELSDEYDQLIRIEELARELGKSQISTRTWLKIHGIEPFPFLSRLHFNQQEVEEALNRKESARRSSPSKKPVQPSRLKLTLRPIDQISDEMVSLSTVARSLGLSQHMTRSWLAKAHIPVLVAPNGRHYLWQTTMQELKATLARHLSLRDIAQQLGRIPAIHPELIEPPWHRAISLSLQAPLSRL